MNKCAAGFSLIELITVIAMSAILLMMALPIWLHFYEQNQAEIAVKQISSALNFARSAAIAHGEKVIFCASRNHLNCGGLWHEGQIVMLQQQVLRVYGKLPDKLYWKSAFGRNDRLEFVASGFTNGQSGSFWICPRNDKWARRIVLEQSGRARVTGEGVDCSEG